MTRPSPLPRRAVLAATGSTALLAACSGPQQDAAAPAAAKGSGTGGGVLAQLTDVPVGGAVAAELDGEPVVVAQPSAGTAVAFSAVCTHRGCTVAPAGAELHCPCHGSAFNALTGAVVHGPAARPLPAVAVTVQDGAVVARG